MPILEYCLIFVVVHVNNLMILYCESFTVRAIYKCWFCMIACLITCLYTGETHELHPAQGNKPSIVVEPCDDPKAKRPVPSKIQQTKRPDLPCSSWSSLKSSKLERETGLIDPMCLVAEWLFIVCIRNEVSAVVHSHRKWILVLKINETLGFQLKLEPTCSLEYFILPADYSFRSISLPGFRTTHFWKGSGLYF